MVSLEANVISLHGKTHSIVRYEVWFITAAGISTTREEAIDVTRNLNGSVLLDIRPVAVAVADDNVYEVLG